MGYKIVIYSLALLAKSLLGHGVTVFSYTSNYVHHLCLDCDVK